MIITDNSGNEGKGTNILATPYPETSYTKASELVSSAILEHPYLKGFYATHFAAATGAAAEILQAGRQGDIKLVAFDAGLQQVCDLRAGVYDALIAQERYTMGHGSVWLLLQFLSGEVTASNIDQSVKTFLLSQRVTKWTIRKFPNFPIWKLANVKNTLDGLQCLLSPSERQDPKFRHSKKLS